MVLGVYICLVQKIEICMFPQVGSADLSIEVREVRHSSLDRGFFALLTFVVACLYLLYYSSSLSSKSITLSIQE